jgi:hypothetical protein
VPEFSVISLGEVCIPKYSLNNAADSLKLILLNNFNLQFKIVLRVSKYVDNKKVRAHVSELSVTLLSIYCQTKDQKKQQQAHKRVFETVTEKSATSSPLDVRNSN